MEQVTSEIKDVRRIDAVYSPTNVSLWVAASPSILYYIYGRRGRDGRTITWNSPVMFAKNVAKLAAMRSRLTKANEAFVLNTDMSITHW